MIQSNIPSRAHPLDNGIGQKAILAMCGHAFRCDVGMNSFHLATTFPDANLAQVLNNAKANGLKAQYNFTGNPSEVGPKCNPGSVFAAEMTTLIQKVVDQIHAIDPNAVLEVSNEMNGGVGAPCNTDGVPLWQALGMPRGWIPGDALTTLWTILSKVNFRGHKLCIHATPFDMSSWNSNAAGVAIIGLVKASGGWIAYNTYPNQKNLLYLVSPTIFANHFFGYTWPNVVANHKKWFGNMPYKLGETGVYYSLATGLVGSRLTAFRQAIVTGALLAGMDATYFCMSSTDSAMQTQFGVVGVADGVPLYGALKLS